MFIIHFLGSMRPEDDGVTRVAHQIRKGFASREDYRQFFVAPLLPEGDRKDMRIIPSFPFPLYPAYHLSLCRESSIRKLLKEMRPDVIHIHTPCTLGRAAVRAAYSLGIPAIATYHTHFPAYLKYYKIDFLKHGIWKYLRSVYNLCDAVIVPSKTTLGELENHGFKNLVSIPHGVDTTRFSPQYRRMDWRDSMAGKGKRIVTYAGRLVWEKNLKLLAEAGSLLKNPESCQFVIIGDGPAKEKLRKMMPYATFTGFLGEQALSVAYASSDIFVFPSTTETFGNVTVEAMASGLPAICSAAGGACDIVRDGFNGLLISRNHNPREWAQAIDYLVSQPNERDRMAKGALTSSADYRWESAIDAYHQLYQAHLRKPKRTGRSSSKAFLLAQSLFLD